MVMRKDCKIYSKSSQLNNSFKRKSNKNVLLLWWLAKTLIKMSNYIMQINSDNCSLYV